jgi:hypothetical protein
MAAHDSALRDRLQFTAEAPGGAYKAAAIAALEAVLDIHKPLSIYGYTPTCDHCIEDVCGMAEYVNWPCATVAAVADALGVNL